MSFSKLQSFPRESPDRLRAMRPQAVQKECLAYVRHMIVPHSVIVKRHLFKRQSRTIYAWAILAEVDLDGLQQPQFQPVITLISVSSPSRLLFLILPEQRSVHLSAVHFPSYLFLPPYHPATRNQAIRQLADSLHTPSRTVQSAQQV